MISIQFSGTTRSVRPFDRPTDRPTVRPSPPPPSSSVLLPSGRGRKDRKGRGERERVTIVREGERKGKKGRKRREKTLLPFSFSFAARRSLRAWASREPKHRSDVFCPSFFHPRFLIHGTTRSVRPLDRPTDRPSGRLLLLLPPPSFFRRGEEESYDREGGREEREEGKEET